MSAPTPDHWQIQEAKQRFSELIRVVTTRAQGRFRAFGRS
jgi:hypothetical protein